MWTIVIDLHYTQNECFSVRLLFHNQLLSKCVHSIPDRAPDNGSLIYISFSFLFFSFISHHRASSFWSPPPSFPSIIAWANLVKRITRYTPNQAFHLLNTLHRGQRVDKTAKQKKQTIYRAWDQIPTPSLHNAINKTRIITRNKKNKPIFVYNFPEANYLQGIVVTRSARHWSMLFYLLLLESISEKLRFVARQSTPRQRRVPPAPQHPQATPSF